jgi:hypothetical protein
LIRPIQANAILHADGSIPANVTKLEASVGEDLPNEETAMAVGWVGLAADECDSMCLCPREKTIYRLAELRLLGHRAV